MLDFLNPVLAFNGRIWYEEQMKTYSYFDSPVGRLLLYGGRRLQGLVFPEGKTRRDPAPEWTYDPGSFDGVKAQLDLYFKGQLTAFDLALDLRGTPFQKQVWQHLTAIPYGRTTTYGDLARDIGNPKAVRAVGLANGKNPVPIIVPCHRVVGKDGSLTGFGGGLAVKQFLLDLERT